MSLEITCCSLTATDVVQVHTFDNSHNYSLDDVVSSQPSIRANRASKVLDDVLRSTPNYYFLFFIF